jgi:hypothetical protein
MLKEQIKMNDDRDTFIDFLRGLAIFDMILVHYAGNFPQAVSKFIIYHDVAMEGFLLLSGLIVGMHYLHLFTADRSSTVKTIYLRTLKLCLIQYILIVTISLSEFILKSGGVEFSGIGKFLFDSFTFSNQVGLIHILPTFIPLFILTPLFLYLLSRNLDYILLMGSVVFFLIAQKYPYFFNYGDKTIFPVVLWQIYFVVGCSLGKAVLRNGTSMPVHKRALFIVSLITFAAALLFRHSTSICPLLAAFMNEHSISIQRFPLNIYGLVWGTLLWLFIYATSAQFWSGIRGMKVVDWTALFGRNSLMTFVLHVYFAKMISILKYKYEIAYLSIYILMLLNIIVTFYLLIIYENKKDSDNKIIFRIIRWLF